MANKPGVIEPDYKEKYGALIGRFKIILSAGFALAIYLVLFWVFPVPNLGAAPVLPEWVPDFLSPDLVVEIRRALGSALLAYAVFGAILELFRYKSATKDIEGTITRVLTTDWKASSQLDLRHKRTRVQTSIKAALGDEIGQATFAQLDPMLQDGAVFRKDFEYQVRLAGVPKARRSGGGGGIDETRYRWIYEKLSYKPYVPSSDSYFSGPYRIALVFDKATISELFQEQGLFCRFLIDLDEPENNQLAAMTAADFEAFVGKTIGLTCEQVQPGGRASKLAFSLSYQPARRPGATDESRRMPYVLVTIGALTGDAANAKLRVACEYPYSRSATYFTFTIPQPTHAPTLSFDYSGVDIRNVELLSYMTSVEGSVEYMQPSDTRPDIYEVKVRDSWVYPTSGVVVVWKNASSHTPPGSG